MDVKWNTLKADNPVGTSVKGQVVHREQFGVFVDIGVGFPALLLVVRFKHANVTPHTSMDMYPQVADELAGRIYVFDDACRQIAVTQLPREPWMEGNW